MKSTIKLGSNRVMRKQEDSVGGRRRRHLEVKEQPEAGGGGLTVADGISSMDGVSGGSGWGAGRRSSWGVERERCST